MSDFNKNLLEGANSRMAAPQVNPLEFPSVLCDKCGCETFIPGYVFKKIPGMVLGKGGETQIVPIEVCVCSKCGELMPEYKAKQEEPKKEKETTLII